MVFSPELADMRFGCGLSPIIASPASVEALWDGLNQPDAMAAAFPIEGFQEYLVWFRKTREMRRTAYKNKENPDLIEAFRAEKRKKTVVSSGWSMQMMLRCAHSQTPIRERMAAFWADHFTAHGKTNLLRTAAAPYLEQAIRPRVNGYFSDLLVSAVTHPIMLHYLDQSASVGPGSRAAKQNKRLSGLNENLAREVLELHTLGVGGPYTQADVRQLAELFTGLTFDAKQGFRFRAAFAEPGAETVLGRQYGGDPAQLEPVIQALTDLALHPATAAHIARKLAVHFVSDQPDEALVQHITTRFIDTGGNLMAVYAALLEHPAAWEVSRPNIKPPNDFIASAWRALAVDPAHIAGMEFRMIRRIHTQPLQLMGQLWLRPNGPDGWPEPDEAWITPPGISARLRWAMAAPRRLRPDLPDPRAFVTHALGSTAPEPVRFAASAAESTREAIGLVLASPAFQRR